MVERVVERKEARTESAIVIRSSYASLLFNEEGRYCG